MYKVWTSFFNYLRIRQLSWLCGFFMVAICQGQTTPSTHLASRAPASYIPDDDVIVKPVDNKLSFYQQYVASDKSEDVARSRNQLKIWSDNQVFASQYGMDSSLTGSSYFVPTADEKWEYFKNRYLRYLRSKGEQPIKDMPKTWYQDYRASNEVDTIDELEGRFKKNQKKSAAQKALPSALQAKEVSLWKKTKFIFQPRLDQGLAVVGFKTSNIYARAWVGVNGRTEVNVQQTYDTIGLRAMFNYYADTGKYFTSLDQRIVENLYARYTSTKDPNHTPDTAYQDDTLMLLYAKQF